MYEYTIKQGLSIKEVVKQAAETNIHTLVIEPDECVQNSQYIIYVHNCGKTSFIIGVYTSSADIPPTCLIDGTVLFIGCDNSIYSIDMDGHILQRVNSTSFFRFIKYHNIIVAVCEADIVFFHTNGQVIHNIATHDIVTEAIIEKNDVLHVSYLEGGHEEIMIPAE